MQIGTVVGMALIGRSAGRNELPGFSRSNGKFFDFLAASTFLSQNRRGSSSTCERIPVAMPIGNSDRLKRELNAPNRELNAWNREPHATRIHARGPYLRPVVSDKNTNPADGGTYHET
jgi:hypothetical protein